MATPMQAVPPELTEALAKIDTETTALAVVVTSMRETISTQMSPADVAEVKGKLDAVAARLQSIAADPNVPLPTEQLPIEPMADRRR